MAVIKRSNWGVSGAGEERGVVSSFVFLLFLKGDAALNLMWREEVGKGRGMRMGATGGEGAPICWEPRKSTKGNFRIDANLFGPIKRINRSYCKIRTMGRSEIRLP
jgi:hypothetical protein